MKSAIIGAGHISYIHAPFIKEQADVEVCAIVDTDIVRARSFASQFDIKHAYDDAKKMLEEQKPNVVHVLTSPQTHAELAILAMDHGAHVLVEKPMALQAADAKRMTDAAERNRVRLCVNHNMVYLSSIRKAIDLARDGAVGDIVSVDVELVFDPRRMASYTEEGAEFSHWIYRLNGGPLQDLMPHPVSIVQEVLDQIDDMEVLSHRMGALPGKWNDEIKILLRSGKKTGVINVSLNEKPDAMSLTIKGRKGKLTADPFTGILIKQKKSCLPRAVIRGLSGFQISRQYFCGAVANVFRFLFGRIDKSNGIGPITNAFYDALRMNRPLPISTEKGILSVELMDRIWPERQVDYDVDSIKSKAAANDGPLTLVTGASGFVGIHVVRKLLDEGYRVRTLVRKNSLHTGRLLALPVEIVEGDLSDPDVVNDAVKGAEYIFHLGAAMSNDWQEQERTTIKGTQNVIDAALANKVKRLVHVSTLAVYELLDKPPRTVIRESSPYQTEPEKLGPYAWSKIEAEKLVTEAIGEKDLNATIVRLGMVLGPLSRVFYPHLGWKLGADVFMPIGGGRTILPLVYIDNVVDGIYGAALSEKARGEVYNLVDQGEVTVMQFLRKFKEVTGSDAKILPMPYFVAWSITAAYEMVSGIGLIKKGATSRAQLRWKQSSMIYDSSKARQDLEWESRVSLEEGMERTFKWYLEKYGV